MVFRRPSVDSQTRGERRGKLLQVIGSFERLALFRLVSGERARSYRVQLSECFVVRNVGYATIFVQSCADRTRSWKR